VDWSVSGNCDGAPTIRLVSVTSNEPERRSATPIVAEGDIRVR
jgi:hypothetical protein